MQPLQLLLCDSEFLRLLMGRQLWSGMGQYLIHVLQAGSAACSTAAQCKAIGRRIAPRVGQRHPVGGAHRHDTTKVVGSAQPFQVGATSEVWQLLGTVKTEFGKFAGVLEKAHTQLDTVQNSIKQAGVRTRAIERQLRGVEALPGSEPQSALGLDDDAGAPRD